MACKWTFDKNGAWNTVVQGQPLKIALVDGQIEVEAAEGILPDLIAALVVDLFEQHGGGGLKANQVTVDFIGSENHPGDA